MAKAKVNELHRQRYGKVSMAKPQWQRQILEGKGSTAKAKAWQEMCGILVYTQAAAGHEGVGENGGKGKSE